jgi:hypothetical protein
MVKQLWFLFVANLFFIQVLHFNFEELRSTFYITHNMNIKKVFLTYRILKFFPDIFFSNFRIDFLLLLSYSCYFQSTILNFKTRYLNFL